MKKLLLIHKVLFAINTLFIVGLFFSFMLPYLPPKKFGLISILSLIVPILIFATILFLIYWILAQHKKHLYLNAFVLVLSFFFIPSLYKIGTSSENAEKNISVMSYNVRKFNKYEWIKDEDIGSKISEFIHEKSPDILALQEYRKFEKFKLEYTYVSNPLNNNYTRNPEKNKKFKSSLAVFSKYPIINDGIIRYDEHYHKSIFADIVKGNDTIRIYNFHLQSLGVIPDQDYFGHSDSEKLLKRLSRSFKQQQVQINILNQHIKNCAYKVILMGDMNNTSYSWVYKRAKNDLKDTFLEAGKGFGRTYNLKGFPLRIDYIFVDEEVKVIQHKNYSVKYSDHFPVMATLAF